MVGSGHESGSPAEVSKPMPPERPEIAARRRKDVNGGPGKPGASSARAARAVGRRERREAETGTASGQAGRSRRDGQEAGSQAGRPCGGTLITERSANGGGSAEDRTRCAGRLPSGERRRGAGRRGRRAELRILTDARTAAAVATKRVDRLRRASDVAASLPPETGRARARNGCRRLRQRRQGTATRGSAAMPAPFCCAARTPPAPLATRRASTAGGATAPTDDAAPPWRIARNPIWRNFSRTRGETGVQA